jgi:putative transposase
VQRYNHERPHQALAMGVPAELYTPSPRPYRGLAEADYLLHDWSVTVTRCGRIRWKRRKINLSTVFAGQNVGVKQVSDRIWLVSVLDYDLGYFLDDETCRLGPIEDPFNPKLLPMSREWTPAVCTLQEVA